MGPAAIGSSLSGLSRGGASSVGKPPSFESALMASRSLKAQPVNLPPAQDFTKPRQDSGAGATAIPQANANPKQVASWWGGLSQDARDTLIRDRHGELGALRGLPAADADRVNRLRLGGDISKLKGDLQTADLSISGRESIGAPTSKADRDRRETLKAELSNAEKIKDQMDRLDRDFSESGATQPYLLTYGREGAGRFAVALGDPDRARNTAIVVPGASHDVRHERGPFAPVEQGLAIHDQMDVEDGRPSPQPGGAEDNAVIVWLGADMPDQAIPAAMNPRYGDARHGARVLADDVAGYEAAIDAARGDALRNLTIVSHSYGTYVTGQAMTLGMRADDVVFVGSPGVGVGKVEDLGGAGEVWAGEADGDIIADVPWFGRNPTNDDFGATVFATDDSRGHSQYLDQGTESLRNIARIATDQDRRVVVRGPE